MKKSALTLLPLLAFTLMLTSCPQGESSSVDTTPSSSEHTASATLVLNFNTDEGSVVITREDGSNVTTTTELVVGETLTITITPNSGYVVESVNGVVDSKTTWEHVVTEGENVINIVFASVEAEFDFAIRGNTISFSMDAYPEGRPLSDFVEFNEGVAPYSLDMEYEENDIFEFDGEKIVPLGAGRVSNVKVYPANDGEATDENSLTINVIITRDTTDIDLFNNAGAFESADGVTAFFDTTGSNRFSEMAIGRGGERDGAYINLWVSDNITSEDELPSLSLKANLSNGVKANTTYTLSYNLDIGIYNTIDFKIDGEKLNTDDEYINYSTKHYHTFVTGDDVSNGVNFELLIAYTLPFPETGLGTGETPWGHLGQLRIDEGDITPVEVARTNYVRDGGFEYYDDDTGYGDSLTWTANNADGILSYESDWGAISGRALYFNHQGPSDLVSYYQDVEITHAGAYTFEYSMTCGSGDPGWDGGLFSTLEWRITNASGDNVLVIGKDKLKTSPELQSANVDLVAGTYRVGFYAQSSATAEQYPYAVIDSIGLYPQSEFVQVTIDGLHHVEQNAQITLDSNYEETEWSVNNDNVTITPSEDGKSLTVTGVNVSDDVIVTATYQNSTFTHQIIVEEPYVPVQDDNLIKDASFEQSGENQALVGDYWTFVCPEGEYPALQWNNDPSEGSHSFNLYYADAISGQHVLKQTNTFTVSQTKEFTLSYSAMGLGFTVTGQIIDSDGTIVGSINTMSAWTGTAADRYQTTTVNLTSGEVYTFQFVFTNITAGAWATLDDITLK